MKLYKTAHYIFDFNKCAPDVQKKIKNTENCLEQLDSAMAKFLIEARKIKLFVGICETSIEINPLYTFEEYCIFFKFELGNLVLLRVGTRSIYLESAFLY